MKLNKKFLKSYLAKVIPGDKFQPDLFNEEELAYVTEGLRDKSYVIDFRNKLAYVTACYSCGGEGLSTCSMCFGSGWVKDFGIDGVEALGA